MLLGVGEHLQAVSKCGELPLRIAVGIQDLHQFRFVHTGTDLPVTLHIQVENPAGLSSGAGGFYLGSHLLSRHNRKEQTGTDQEG